MSDRPILRQKLRNHFQKIKEARRNYQSKVWVHPSRKPVVLSEWKTLEKVLDGVSLSRYGDGEIKHMDGRRNVSQVFHESLQTSLKTVFHTPIKNHLVGIPNVFNGRAFTEVDDGYIDSMRRRFGKIINRERLYGSSYITRGDLCPYLSWVSYWGLISELWRDRDVVLVRGKEKRANPGNMMAQARNIDHVETPSSGAWSEYSRIKKECLRHPRDGCIYLLCVGPTATVLAYDLCMSGRWSVDIGHLGLFYKMLGKEHDDEPQVWNHRPTDPGYIKGVTDKC